MVTSTVNDGRVGASEACMPGVAASATAWRTAAEARHTTIRTATEYYASGMHWTPGVRPWGAIPLRLDGAAFDNRERAVVPSKNRRGATPRREEQWKGSE